MSLKLNLAMKPYLPARLVKTKDRWYIIFYQTDPTTGIRQRHRETFDLGRYPKQDRLKRAREIISSVNAQLPYGYPWNRDFYQREVVITIPEAFAMVTNLGSDLRHATKVSYASSMRKFEALFLRLMSTKNPSQPSLVRLQWHTPIILWQLA